MPKLLLDFTGLCTFVEHPEGMKVLFVEGRARQNNLMHVTSAVRFNRKDLHSSSPQRPDLVLEQNLPPHIMDSLCFLPNGDYRIEAQITGPAGVEPNRTRTSSSAEPTEDDRHDWSWVPELERIEPGAGIPQAAWFDPKPPTEIGARFTLPRGRFSTRDFLRREGVVGAQTKVDIFELNRTYDQALASFALCDMDVGAGLVKLVHKPWSGAENDFLVFDSRGSDLNIEIWNVPFPDVMTTFFPGSAGKPPDHNWRHGFDAGVSFQHFYRLNNPPSKPFPGNHNRRSSTGLLHSLKEQKDQGCSPTQAPRFTPQG